MPQRANDFRMSGMADEENLPPALMMKLGLAMHFCDQRACRIDRKNLALLSDFGNGFRHAMSREDDRLCRIGNLVELFDENRALGL